MNEEGGMRKDEGGRMKEESGRMNEDKNVEGGVMSDAGT